MEKQEKAKGKSQINLFGLILIIASVLAVAICTVMFSVMGVRMSQKSNETMDSIGGRYMGSLGDQEAKRFETAMGIRLEQVCSLARATPPNSNEDMEVTKEILCTEAIARDFAYLAVYDASAFELNSADPDYDSHECFSMILGEQVGLDDPVPFFKSITGDGNPEEATNKVAVGKDKAGNEIILMGVVGKGVKGQSSEDWVFPVDYKLPDGGKAAALVAGVPVEYIASMLKLDSAVQEQSVYSHIIRKNGTYVIKSEEIDDEIDNYFARIREMVDSEARAEKFINSLNESMENGEHFSALLESSDETQLRIHCCSLSYSEWQLVTVMQSDDIGNAVAALNKTWVVTIIIMVTVTVLVLVALFALYMVFNRLNAKRLKEARVAAEKANRAKSEFLSRMSHDIRSPMNAIVGMTAIATANIDDKASVQNCLKKITLSSKHLLGLINDVLDMSKIESGKMTLNMEQVSLREVLDGISTIAQPQVKTKQQKFYINVGNIIEENVYCDSVRLNQVLLNLLSNAIKFTPENGVITLALNEEASPVGDDFVRVHVIVKDTGIGMSEELQKKVFESFVREDSMRVHKTEGSGLGMAITKHIVDAMKGTIELKSELGKGTEFHVTLDLEKAQKVEEEMILPDWNMLVVDDDRDLCETTVVSLGEIGINAEWTLSGEDAVVKAVARHNERRDYNVVLMDWKLPGMDGIETAKQLRRELGEDIPILLISAYDCTEIEQEAREAGINGFISKPLFKSTLYYGLKKFVGSDESIAERKAQDCSLKGTNILLAEDNDLNWEIAETLLESEGANVVRAENGKICVEMFAGSKPNEYDAILMDIRMPVMTGYEAAEEIRKLDRSDKDIPIIAMTADAFADDIKHCIDCGMNAHIAKPIDIDKVKVLLMKYISEYKNK